MKCRFIISKNVIAKLLIAMSPLASDMTKKFYAKNKTIQKKEEAKGKKRNYMSVWHNLENASVSQILIF
jgi:hypothetical protein